METAFKCDLCSKECDSVDELNGHIKRQHEGDHDSKKKSFKCNLCGYECSKGKDLIKHMRRHTGERPFKCEVSNCGWLFKRESHLKRHIKRKHGDEPPLKCDFSSCLYAAKTASNLKEHKKLHSDERQFACPHSGCSYRAKIKGNLSQHTANVHSESKTLTCSKCKYNTNVARNLLRHMIVHERKNENIPCSKEGCEYKGKNSGAFQLHMRRHKTLFPCPVSGCGRYVCTKKALENHLKLHNPSGRAFQCPLCCKHFPTMVQLQNHCTVHTNEKPFQCGHCKHQAATLGLVKAHILSVHPAIEFPCIAHLKDVRECLRCKVILPSTLFPIHSMIHAFPVVTIKRLEIKCSRQIFQAQEIVIVVQESKQK